MKTRVGRVTGSGTANQQTRRIRRYCRNKSMVERVSAARADGAQGEGEVLLPAAWRADGVATDKEAAATLRIGPVICASHTWSQGYALES
jgi:hypothetical protein